MKNLKLAIVGAGVMGEVILKGIIEANIYQPENIMVTALRVEKLERLHQDFNVQITTDNRLVSQFADVILLAIKPGDVQKVLKEIVAGGLKDECLIISIAAGVSIEKITGFLSKEYPVIRVMTNTPCQVGRGISALSGNQSVLSNHIKLAQEIFNSVGESITLPEKYLDAVTGLSGSGPAFLFLIAETLIDAGVLQGLPRDVSRKLVIETMIGSALLLEKSGQHPASLKDMVTSPGGTTIAGIQVMEEYKVRAALLKVVETATKKSKELGELG
ncbi:MAG: pyrroline-5-carboxylate reductase [Candidatus Sericytochromatia bacterium]|nr:pyrroline-5-carboxylate reductase [Candidatus Sericytochromatia bacterium]